jgi:hypothetical protein
MDKKKPNVAAELSMYWDSVCMAPRGPAPPLRYEQYELNANSDGKFTHAPEDTEATENEANGQANTSAHGGTHPEVELSRCMQGFRKQDARTVYGEGTQPWAPSDGTCTLTYFTATNVQHSIDDMLCGVHLLFCQTLGCCACAMSIYFFGVGRVRWVTVDEVTRETCARCHVPNGTGFPCSPRIRHLRRITSGGSLPPKHAPVLSKCADRTNQCVFDGLFKINAWSNDMLS